MLDIVIIGAGLSGLMAAYAAAQAGKKVRVVSKGLGMLHWGAGAIDVLGYHPAQPDEVVKRPLSQIDALLDANPDHPYRLLSADERRAALDAFLALTEEIGLPYVTAVTEGENLLLPSPAGAARPTYLAPQAQAAGDLSRDEPMLIVGFAGMRDFYPALIAENLQKQGYEARAALLPLSLVTDRRDYNTVILATGVDGRKRYEELGRELKQIVKPNERIGLPAILGMDAHNQVMAALERRSGVPIFEIPTLSPSVPGVRLFKALRQKLWEMGVRVEAGMEVVNAETAGNEVKYIETATSARPLKHRASQYVLATGGILGGGFNSDVTGRVWETIFDLPLSIPQKRDDWFHATFLAPEGHPVFHGGVRVNENFQPINGGDRPVYANLWAAGNALGDFDGIQERSLEGTAVITGYAAGKAISG